MISSNAKIATMKSIEYANQENLKDSFLAEFSRKILNDLFVQNEMNVIWKSDGHNPYRRQKR